MTLTKKTQIAGEQWKTLRQKMTTTFSSGKIKGMMPTLTKISQELTEFVDEKAENATHVNYRDLASRFMCEIIGEVAFGLKCKKIKSISFKHRLDYFWHNKHFSISR